MVERAASAFHSVFSPGGQKACVVDVIVTEQMVACAVAAVAVLGKHTHFLIEPGMAEIRNRARAQGVPQTVDRVQEAPGKTYA